MARGKYATRSSALDTLAKGPHASSYVRYNLGVALLRSGDLARGTALLDGVGKMTPPARSTGACATRRMSRSASPRCRKAGSQQARIYLERVRLSGMYSNKALLGFGWAAAEQRQMKKALVPWSELATRNPGDAAVLEAKLAVPYALTELGANAQALELYQDAIGVFDRQSADLDDPSPRSAAASCSTD